MHFDLWPAPMRAGIVRAAAATYSRWRRLYTGIRRAAEAKQRPLPFVKATRRGTKARRGSDRRRRDVDGNYGAIREALLT